VHTSHIFYQRKTKPKNQQNPSNKETDEQLQKSGVVPATKPLVSVSWPVPCKINRDKNHEKTNPEIYSDYSGPRTRPPSLN
ncbi:hypothetical protein KJ032_27210, partial [Salmonella enterica subsp. enterica serovar Typhimurium]|nr:hypothetical protein [Salmonella enterica subsp. enterica serovar Typhimurium]